MSVERKRALVFEDIDLDWERLRRALNEAGFDVTRASTPDEFRAYAPYIQFQLILVDIFLGKLPDLQEVGIQLTREIKEMNSDIPVLVVSDREPDRMIVADAFRAGAADYVDKKEFLKHALNVTKRINADSDHKRRRVEEELPLPMAFLYRDYLYSHTTFKRSIERMVELFEVTLKLATFPLLASHRAELQNLLPRDLREALARPSLGHFAHALNVLPEVSGFLRPLSQATRSKRFRGLCQKFIELRNNFIAHGISQTDLVYERLVNEHDAALKELLGLLDCFRHLQLLWPSKAEFEGEYYVYDEARIFRGTNPEITPTKIRTKLVFKFTKHVHLVDEAFSDSVDLFPWCQYLYCEQVCLNRKLFLYRLAREGEILGLDHIYGHSLQTREGWNEVKAIISPT